MLLDFNIYVEYDEHACPHTKHQEYDWDEEEFVDQASALFPLLQILHVDMRISMNHNSLGCEHLDVGQSSDAQDAFWPMPGLFSWAGVTGSVGACMSLSHCH